MNRKPPSAQGALAVQGYVIVGPRGMMPGTFRVSRENVTKNAEAVIVLNRYKAGEVWIAPAVLMVPPSAADVSRWGLSQVDPERGDELDAHVAQIQRQVEREANKARRGRKRR